MGSLIRTIIFIGIALGVYYMYVRPTMAEVRVLQDTVNTYDQALGAAKELQARGDELATRYSSFRPEDVNRLRTMLPDAVENVRLIIDIQQVAQEKGLVFKSVVYNTVEQQQPAANTTTTRVPSLGTPLDRSVYGSYPMQFTVTGRYSDFISFVESIEKSLRLIDITGVQFSSASTTSGRGATPVAPDVYDYTVEITTYWMRP